MLCLKSHKHKKLALYEPQAAHCFSLTHPVVELLLPVGPRGKIKDVVTIMMSGVQVVLHIINVVFVGRLQTLGWE